MVERCKEFAGELYMVVDEEIQENTGRYKAMVKYKVCYVHRRLSRHMDCAC